MIINEVSYAAKLPLPINKHVVTLESRGESVIEEGAIRRVGMKIKETNQPLFIADKTNYVAKTNTNKNNILNIHGLKKLENQTVGTQAKSQFRNIMEEKSFKERFTQTRKTFSKSTASDIQAPIRLSFQLMTRAEPAAMVIKTIKSLLAIKADHDEILIVDNNNTETALYEPLAQFCASLDARHNVHFYHIDAVAGFKAGALNLALGLMDPNCSHVVVVDSDYQALPHARASIVSAIKHYPNHALLQFPQFYRDAGRVNIHSELNHYFNHHLYRAFNRTRALSTGTYAVIRRSALLSLGGWSGASITEDAQMGVLMHRRGLRSQFIPEVIATGLLPNTLHDLMSQRRRWIYGNMQVLNTYFFMDSSSTPITKNLSERLSYMRAHLSQLSAWVNFTGIFILLQLLTLLIITGALLFSTSLDIHALLAPLYIVYASYAVFLGRRLWAYMQDDVPLNQQVKNGHVSTLKSRLQAFAVHLNCWELGALSWWPVLWGQKKPFICTPKQDHVRTRKSVLIANLMALPKLLLMINITTAIIVSPFSPLYSPLLFGGAVIVCLLKIWATKVMLDNYSYAEYKIANETIAIDKPINHKSSQPRMTGSKLKDKPLASSFKDDNAVNF